MHGTAFVDDFDNESEKDEADVGKLLSDSVGKTAKAIIGRNIPFWLFCDIFPKPHHVSYVLKLFSWRFADNADNGGPG
jgi:hypothetical protein